MVIIVNEIDINKYKNILNKNKNIKVDYSSIGNYIKKLSIRIMITIITLLIIGMLYKSNNMKDKIEKYLFTDNISFVKINNIYDKYLGGILPLDSTSNTVEVFDEDIKYNDISIYYDGVVLDVEDSYLVPVLREGMVVFIGEKDNYGNTVIIEDLDGIRTWYGNISNTSLKLYDYVSKGTLLGEASNKLYLVFSKEDKYLNYEEYIK